jgi:hypothetical protein
MALNDIKVPKENAGGTFDEIALAASDLKLGTTANLPLKTGTNGVVEAGSFGTAAGSFCEGNDARLSDDRDPNAHAASHLPDGADELFDQSLNTDDRPAFAGIDVIEGQNIKFVDTNENEARISFIEGNAIEFDSNNKVILNIDFGENPIVNFNAPFQFLSDNDGAKKSATLTNLGAAASGSITSSGLTQATARILGRTTASTGAVEEIQIGSGLSLSAGELSSTVSAGIPATLLDAKGDLIVASAADTAARLAVGGTDGHVLTVDSTETLGLKYAALPAELVIACSDETSNLTTGTAKVTFRMPYAMTLSSVRASVNTAPTGSTLIVDINEAGSTTLSTKLSIDASELTSTTAASAAVISDTALADDAEITIDIDQIGSTVAGKGLKVILRGTRA